MKQRKIETEIGRGTTIRGRLTGAEPLSVYGRVEGAIDLSALLVIERTGVVKADVSADEVVVRGIVIGDISAKRVVRLEAGAQVRGDVSAPSVAIAEGARLHGGLFAGDPEADQVPPPRYEPEPEQPPVPAEVVMRPVESEPRPKRRIVVKKRR